MLMRYASLSHIHTHTLQCNVMVPSHQSISLTPWYQVYYSGMHQSRIYAIAYVFIALPKGTFWWPTVLTLWYYHIGIYRLCHNASLVCLSLANTPQLQCNVMAPSHHSILVTPWYPGILLWYGSFSHIRHILLPASSLRANHPA